MHVPDYVILDLSQSLPRMTEALHRSYEHLPDISAGMVEEEIEDSLLKIFQCLEQRDIAGDALRDLCESQCQHDLDFDQGQYRYAEMMHAVGKDALVQFHQLGMYYGGEFLPFFYKERLGGHAIILQRVGHRGEDDF